MELNVCDCLRSANWGWKFAKHQFCQKIPGVSIETRHLFRSLWSIGTMEDVYWKEVSFNDSVDGNNEV